MTRPALTFICDRKRHLVCLPYSVENLHQMAHYFGIAAAWYHIGKGLPHYDIPARRIKEITAQCIVVHPRDVVRVIHGELTQVTPSPEIT